MAADRRYRQQNRVTSDREKFYVYGNAVRQAEVQPKRRQEVRPAKTGKTSSQVMRNRNRAMKISPAYAIFFILAAVCTVAVCVVYTDCRQKLLQDQLMLLRCRKNLRT